MIDLLNRYFVSVYLHTGDYRDVGAVSIDERAELFRIRREATKLELSVGTVHFFFLAPSGEVFDSMHVKYNSRLDDALVRSIKRFNVQPGGPVVAPKPQSRPPAVSADSTILHLAARRRVGSWNGVVENWIVLDKSEWSQFVLPPTFEEEVEWQIAPDVSAKILTHFYPATGNNDTSSNDFISQHLNVRIVSINGNQARAVVRGKVRMRHDFFPNRPDGRIAEATLVGIVEFTRGGGLPGSLMLTTERGRYDGDDFHVAVRLHQSET